MVKQPTSTKISSSVRPTQSHILTRLPRVLTRARGGCSSVHGGRPNKLGIRSFITPPTTETQVHPGILRGMRAAAGL